MPHGIVFIWTGTGPPLTEQVQYLIPAGSGSGITTKPSWPAADIKRPTVGQFYIEANIVVTNHGTWQQGGRLWGANANSTWNNAENATLRYGADYLMSNGLNGTLNASADGNTIEYTLTNTQEIKVPVDNTYYNLIIGGSGNKNLQANINVLGDLTISSILNSNNYAIQLSGDWLSTGVFNAGTSQVTLVGAADQTISNPAGETFYDLMINEVSGSVLLDHDVTVSNVLTMSGGDINTQGNTLTLGLNTGAIGTLNHNSGTVIGIFERWISGTGTPFLFPIGTASWYRPANITFNSLTDGSLIAEFISAAPGNSGLPLTDGADDIHNAFLDGYWTLTRANSLASNDYDLDLTGNGFSSFPIVPETRLLVRPNS